MTDKERAASVVLLHANRLAIIRCWNHCRGAFEVVTRENRTLILDAEGVGHWLSEILRKELYLQNTPLGRKLLDAMENLADLVPWWEVHP